MTVLQYTKVPVCNEKLKEKKDFGKIAGGIAW